MSNEEEERKKRLDGYQRRYMAAAHGMQTGVAYKMEHEPGETTPKHLRVGVNSAMRDHSSLARLLIEKGLINDEEYLRAIAEGMEAERDMYQQWVNSRLGREGLEIKLG